MMVKVEGSEEMPRDFVFYSLSFPHPAQSKITDNGLVLERVLALKFACLAL